ncbi:Imm49 family immunity protein [Marinomonas posidonica]|uniref:Uncharacterized protein n=1 Tax=Marinomonas posidonica (strain CECT 7376 / NCIMB 14433 / IVIA-Po-181) TaxID=491952 RepID=F6D149_MARPP|nr:Imm49 family immunity protein [Marinomonas posidonica]AEF54856.1 hypothetical protein Mar181_1818 [Marinomonas posidonica IVIA-Po-181]
MTPRVVNDKMVFRLQHCDNEVNSDFNSTEGLEEICKMIEEGVEHSPALFRLLARYLEAKAMSHWFHGGDLETFKNLCYNIFKLKYIGNHTPYNSFETHNINSESAIFILSDYEPLIDWLGHRMDEIELDPAKTDIVKEGAFTRLQNILAWQGQLDVLGERAERFVSNPPTNGIKVYLIDQQFYLALAKGDVQGMEAVIKELVSPRKMNHRKGWDSSAYMQGLVVPSALKYSKLAIRYGYELNVDSPHLPKEWLPVNRLVCYEDEFDFMKKYEV